MKRFQGGVMIYMWRLSQAVAALENAIDETLSDMQTKPGKNTFRAEVRNVERLFRRLIAAHDRLEPNEKLKLVRLGDDHE